MEPDFKEGMPILPGDGNLLKGFKMSTNNCIEGVKKEMKVSTFAR